MKLQCIIVDDESLGRKLIESYMLLFPFLELVAVCKNAFEAMEVLKDKERPIDLIFLDIQMPGMLGTQFLQSLSHSPLVIFITAYSHYAVESYELGVVDYLMKPVSTERFGKAVHKAWDMAESRRNQNQTTPTEKLISHEDVFFVSSGYALVKVNVSEITHIESMKDYVKIYVSTSKTPITTKSTLKGIEEKLPGDKFLKVHKSFIVCLHKIVSIKSQNILIGEYNIPVSDTYFDQLMSAIKPMN